MWRVCWQGEFKAKIDYIKHILLYMYALFKEGDKDTMNSLVMLDVLFTDSWSFREWNLRARTPQLQ